MDYNYQNSNYSSQNEPDYYEMYTANQIKTAKGVFSRFHFSLLAYIVTALAVSFIAEIAMLVALGTDGTAEFLKNHVYINWLLSFVPMYLVAFPAFFLMVKNMKTISVEKRKMTALEFFEFFLIAELMMSVGSMIGNTLNEFFSVIKGDSVIDHTSELISSMPVWLTLIIVVVIGPIVEEFIFRKLMIDRLSRYGNLVAVLVSSISFGLFHGNLYQFFYATFVGLVFGFIYAKTRNIIYPVLMHVLVNFLGSVATQPIMEKANELTDSLIAIESGAEIQMSDFFKNLMIVGSYSIIQYAMIIGGAVMIYRFFKYKKFKIRDTWEYKLPRERAASIIIMNPGTIAFLFVSVILFVYSVII